jgi:hypothetical protein
VSVFSEPNDQLLQSSSGTVILCQYQGSNAYQVVEVSSILSVVSMVPQQQDGVLAYFLGEKIGLDITYLAGIAEDSDGSRLEEEDVL